MTIYYGFDEVLYGWDRYFDLCNAFELRQESNPDDDPNTATLNRWRVDSPKGFAWIMHVDRAVIDGLLTSFEAGSPSVADAADGLRRTEERAHALAAKALMLATPPDLPPSDTSRALIRDLAGQLREHSPKRVLLWEPSGLWTDEDAGAIAEQCGLTLTVDPFLRNAEGQAPSPAPVAAYRVTERAAARRQFDSWEMEQLINWADANERTFVLLAGRYQIPHAKELAHLLRSE